MFGVLPIPWSKSHTYTITLTGGKRGNIMTPYVAHVERIGETIQRLWKQATVTPDRNAS